MLTTFSGCAARKLPSQEQKVEPEAAGEDRRQNMIVDVEHATCILLPSEDSTVEPAPVTIDDDHLLTIKALRNGDASVPARLGRFD
ncbi:hypothetical protein N9Z70_02715 [Mariniblastus sp.]|nr:hypothetical protein [Mariniblastus sp.]